MRAEIRSFYSPDVDDVTTWRSNGADFCVLVSFAIGAVGEAGEENFDLLVVGLDWFAREVTEQGIVFTQHTIVVDGFVWRDILNRVEKFVRTWDAPTWKELGTKISRLAHWEFEDCHPDSGGGGGTEAVRE